MAKKTTEECIEITEAALWTCANTCACTDSAGIALKMAEATEKLANSLNCLTSIKRKEK